MNIFPQLKRTPLKRSTKRIKPKSAGITITKDGRTIRRGSSYAIWRAMVYAYQNGCCATCGRNTDLHVDVECDWSFHIHHIYGRGGGKRDDVIERDGKRICRGDCGECHRKEHGQ